jgi:RsiW-degrading membrane proteinase PrsW (M82 family)
MSLFSILISLLVAVGIPLIFLVLLYSFDLYGNRNIRLVLIAFLWGGIIGLGVAYLINTGITVPLLREFRLSYILLYVAFAPLVEEIVKLTPLVPYVQRAKVTYFVDGAIYGFASGIGFSITENILYISQYPNIALPLAVARAFSTSLMHGATTGLVGAGYGLFRLRRFRHRGLLMGFGWISAVAFHSLFNSLVISVGREPLISTAGAMAIGIASFALTLSYVAVGLEHERRWLEESLDEEMVALLYENLTPEERSWLTETLDVQAGVSIAEIKASQAYERLDMLLEPVYEQFPEQARQMDRIVRRQAQIGIKRRLFREIDDAAFQSQLQQEITALEQETRRLRKEVGPCAMSYLNCIFDEDGEIMRFCVDAIAVCDDPFEIAFNDPQVATDPQADPQSTESAGLE